MAGLPLLFDLVKLDSTQFISPLPYLALGPAAGGASKFSNRPLPTSEVQLLGEEIGVLLNGGC